MKYNVGDKVRIKSIDWYNENKDPKHGFVNFGDGICFYSHMSKYCGKTMTISEIVDCCYVMAECVYDNCNWTDKMIEELVEEATEPELKFKVGDKVITDTNMKGKIIEVVEEGWYRVEFEPYNGIPQPNGVVPEESMTIMTKETKPEPKFKVGDIIISDVFTTNDDKGWKVIDVERTGYKLISVNSGLICDMDFKNEYYYKLVEEEMPLDKAEQITDFEYEGLAYTLPNGYIFKDENGNVINATKIVLEKKKKEYPKTYEECCKILGCKANHFFTNFSYNGLDIEISDYEDKIDDLLQNFRKLRYCRDAYWKIAGEEMGLGKPWEPDWNNDEWPDMSYISYDGKSIDKENGFPCCNMILIFPTEEMRDAFYENFKKEIEMYKELL